MNKLSKISTQMMKIGLAMILCSLLIPLGIMFFMILLTII